MVGLFFCRIRQNFGWKFDYIFKYNKKKYTAKIEYNLDKFGISREIDSSSLLCIYYEI